jgi:hypothetical protein
MPVTMTEKQIVDGELRGIGEVVTSDETTEGVLVAHGKAVPIEEEKPKYVQHEKVSDSKKGGKE